MRSTQVVMDGKEMNLVQKIIPHLWFDTEAREAAMFYTGLFENSKFVDAKIIKNPPPYGDAEIVVFELCGQEFNAISAGPYFKFNPTISLMVACFDVAEVDRLWKALSEGGSELMPLGEYLFSKWYAWVQDRYGLSWQLMLTEGNPKGSKITTNLLFSDGACGRAEEAVRYYAEVFENSDIGLVSWYQNGEAQSAKARVNYAAFTSEGSALCAMDNAFDVDFTFNEAFSFVINCKDQREIDYFWEKLSADPEAENCGWCKDKFGVSWQVVPANMEKILFDEAGEQILAVSEAVMKMKKIDIDVLSKARSGQL